MSDIKVLALGSAVQLKDDDTIYIIVSRGFRKQGSMIVNGYVGVPHPFGQNNKYKNTVFTDDDVLNVIQQGYEDKNDSIFIDNQRQKAIDTPENPIKQNTGLDEKNISRSAEKRLRLDSSEQRENDPFYIFKHEH